MSREASAESIEKASNHTSFLARRAIELIAEARRKALEGDLGPASQRLRLTCQFIADTFGDSHPELPGLYELLSEVLGTLGARSESEKYQVLSWELRIAREKQGRKLWEASRLAHLLECPASNGGWPAELTALSEHLSSAVEAPRFPEIALVGSERRGQAGTLRELGRRAVERLWTTRLFLAEELFKIFSVIPAESTRRTFVERLDQSRVVLIEGIYPERLSFATSRGIRHLLDQRRDRRLTILSLYLDTKTPDGRVRSKDLSFAFLGKGAKLIRMDP